MGGRRGVPSLKKASATKGERGVPSLKKASAAKGGRGVPSLKKASAAKGGKAKQKISINLAAREKKLRLPTHRERLCSRNRIKGIYFQILDTRR